MTLTYGEKPSRTLDQKFAPQSIHWATVEGDRAAVARELIGVVKAEVAPEVQADAKAEVVALLERYEQCTAVQPDHIKQIRKDPRLWEMRIPAKAYRLLIRIYETEIDELPKHLVALRVHQKEIVQGDAAATRAAQNSEIDVASARWDAGRTTCWGLNSGV